VYIHGYWIPTFVKIYEGIMYPKGPRGRTIIRVSPVAGWMELQINF